MTIKPKYTIIKAKHAIIALEAYEESTMRVHKKTGSSGNMLLDMFVDIFHAYHIDKRLSEVTAAMRDAETIFNKDIGH